MRTAMIASFVVIAFTSAPAFAGECPLLHAQVIAQTDNRFDTGRHSARALAAEGEALHKDRKHAESVKKYEEAAKAAGVTLARKK